ncbi:MAG: tetratricopeptide repeat protein [Sedimentisphaerales bacterium]|nr:tetratricopeptide repeat protein [Sedimentisphaerales bacterium]
MARKKKKKVNKKLISLLLLIGVPIFLLGLYILDSKRPFLPGFVHKILGHDPEKLFEESQKLMEEADQIKADNEAKAAQLEDPEEAFNLLQTLNEGDYKDKQREASQTFGQAYRFAKGNEELLNQILTYRGEYFLRNSDYENALKVWSTLNQLDGTNFYARKNIVEYYYEKAKNIGRSDAWSELIKLTDPLIDLEGNDPFGYLVKAHAKLELMISQTTDEEPDKVHREVEELLQKAQETDDQQVLIYRLGGMLAMFDAQNKKTPAEKEKYWVLAEKTLRQGIDKNPDDIEAYKAYYEVYQQPLLAEKLLQIQSDKYVMQTTESEIEKEQARLNLENSQADYDSLKKRALENIDSWLTQFSQDGYFYTVKAGMLLGEVKELSDTQKVIKLYEKALACDDTNALWLTSLGRLYLLNAELGDDVKQDLQTALKLFRRVLYLPHYQDEPGPRQASIRALRYGLLMPELIEVCIQLSDNVEESQKSIYLEMAKKYLMEMRDKIGETHSLVKASEGAIALAEGKQEEGIRILYNIEKELKEMESIKYMASRVQWKLFRALRDTEYKALAVYYGFESIQIMTRSSRDELDYVETYSSLPLRISKEQALRLIEMFIDKYPSNEELKQKFLLKKAEILAVLNQLEAVKEILTELKGETKELRFLRAIVLDNPVEREQAVRELAQEYPDDMDILDWLNEFYRQYGPQYPDFYDKARNIMEIAVKAHPDNFILQKRRLVFLESDPVNISAEKLEEIDLAAAKNITDPYQQALVLGTHYIDLAQRGIPGEETQRQWKRALDYIEEALKFKEDMEPLIHAFNISLELENWSKAEELLVKIKKHNETEMLFYEAKLYQYQNDWETSINRLLSYLEKRPISIEGHLSLAESYFRVQRIEDAIREARTAISQDRLSFQANRMLAILLHNRNLELGLNNLDLEQISEILIPSRTVIRINPNETQLNRLYIIYSTLQLALLGEQIKRPGTTELAKEQFGERVELIHQIVDRIGRLSLMLEPQNVSNWDLLAGWYYQYAECVDDPVLRQSLLTEAEKLYQDGKAQNPQSADLLASYGEFLRKTGRAGEDERLLQEMIAQNTGKVKHEAMISLSRLYEQKNEIDKAGTLLFEILKEDNNNRLAASMLLELFIKVQRYDDALKLLSMMRSGEDNIYLMTREVDVLLMIGRNEDAEPILNQIKEQYPDSREAIILSARLAILNTKYTEAVVYADQAIVKDPTDQVAYILKGRALYYSDQLQKALDTFKQLRGLVTGDNNLGRIDMARINWRLGYYSDAISELQTAVEADASYIEARKLLIKMLRARNRWSDLERLYDSTLTIYPQEVLLYVEAAMSALFAGDQYMENEEFSDASRQYQNALKLMQDGLTVSQETKKHTLEAINGMLKVLLNKEIGQYQKALAIADQVITRGGASPDMLLNKAEALYRLGRPQEALDLFEKVLNMVNDQPEVSDLVLANIRRIGEPTDIISWGKKKLLQNPDWTAMHLVLAGIYRDTGQMEQEITELEAARSSASEKLAEPIDKQLSISYMSNRQWQKGIAISRDLIEKHPENSYFLNNLAYALLEQGDHDEEAVKYAQEAYDLNRLDTNIMDTYAMALMRFKNYEQAELIMRRAIQESQKTEGSAPPEYEYHLGQALIGQGENEKARQRLSRTLELLSDSNDPDAQEWRDRINKLMETSS